MGTCIVCGKPFHEGQGVVVEVRGRILEFHSSRCASKFLRRLLEAGEDCVERAAARVAGEYEETLKAASRGKVI